MSTTASSRHLSYLASVTTSSTAATVRLLLTGLEPGVGLIAAVVEQHSLSVAV
jgi:hypothetical protein